MPEKNTIFESVGDFFGLEIKKKKEKMLPSFVAPQTDDGALEISSSMAGSFGQYVDTGEQLRNDHELVNKYRDMALQSEIELAISDIVNEAIVIDEEELPITINADEIEFSTKIKNSISEEFENILELLNFNNRGYDIFRQWYIDGRLFYHVVVDENKKSEGIQELRNIDPRKIKKVREVKKNAIRTAGTVTANIIDDIEEFFVYNKDGFVNAEVGLKINPDAVVFVPSGILDINNKLVLGYLHKAIRPLNNLKIMEDSLVVYRIARAPERRVFYIDVGNLPRPKAELYVATVMAKFKNKTVYDATTGEVKDDKRYLSMLEDYWLPRRGSGKGTEVQQLAGGQNLSSIEDISYFQEKLFRALNVPFSRLKTDDQWGMGQTSQISRDEVRFSKFIYKLRNKFNQLFDELLKRQLILKGVINEEDWDEISSKIKFEYANDSFFSELKNMEITKERFNLLGEIDQYTTNGISPTKTPYLSVEWVMKNVLKQDEKEIKKTAKEVKEELEESQKLMPNPGMEDPNAQDPLSGLDDIENGTDATPPGGQAPADPNQAPVPPATQKGAPQNLNGKQPKKDEVPPEKKSVAKKEASSNKDSVTEPPKKFRKGTGFKKVHKNPKQTDK